MSTVNWPSSPTLGQMYTFETFTWIFNGYGWKSIPYGGAVTQAWYLVSPYIYVVAEALPDADLLDSFYSWHLVNYV